MDVGTFDMKHFSEYALLCHIQGCQFKEVIHAVFQLHAVFAGSFRSVDKFPDFVERHSRRDFYGHMLSMFHCIDSHFSMVLPVGYDIYEVDIIPFAQLFPCVFRPAVGSGFGHPCLFKDFL